jgi:hypothetical protein
MTLRPPTSIEFLTGIRKTNTAKVSALLCCLDKVNTWSTFENFFCVCQINGRSAAHTPVVMGVSVTPIYMHVCVCVCE